MPSARRHSLHSRFVPLLATAALVASYPPLSVARENAYDVVGKVLTPFVRIFSEKSKNSQRAVTMQVRLDQADVDPKLGPLRATFALEAPDKLRLTAPILGQEITVCRHKQELWAYPGSRVRALLENPDVQKRLPAPNPKFKLAAFRLPIPEKQLAFLPILFQVREGAEEVIGGERCRVLDLQLMPELARSLKAEEWAARMWVTADYRPARISVSNQDGQVTFAVDELKFSESLPDETWAPTEAQNRDVLDLSPQLYDQLVRALFANK